MVLFSCGCGEKTTDREDAVAHVVGKGHTMTASGVIRPEEVGAHKPAKVVRRWRQEKGE
jgi:hypothetical protein